MLKHCFTHLIILIIFTACKNNEQVIVFKNELQSDTATLYTNDSVQSFNRLKNRIIRKAESNSSLKNSMTLHFKKYISENIIKEVKFKDWRKNIYLEFTVDKNKHITYLSTNASNQRLDTQIKKAFKKLDAQLISLENFHTTSKYSIVIIQNINNKPVVKCNPKAIAYTPPIFSDCSKETTYAHLNKCNYLYLSDFLYNNVDLRLIEDIDIENNHQIYPKLIINKKGVVIAAKVESENKEFLESYYKAIKNIPRANKPAKFNGTNEYYGYNFPTSIINVIKNNNDFKQRYSHKVIDYVNAQKMMKHYVHYLRQHNPISYSPKMNYK